MSRNVEDVLERAGEYLMQRTAEYRELPIAPPSSHMGPRRRVSGRRLLVAVGATGALAAAVLVGTFIGDSTPGGPAEVAQAAWSATPIAPTLDQSARLTTQCSADVQTVFGAGLAEMGGEAAPLAGDYLRPVIAEVRGTTALAVYVSPGTVALCATFADGSIIVRAFSGAIEPGQTLARGLDMDGERYMVVTGLLPAGASGGVVTVLRPGQEDVTATVSADRYAAWMPTPTNYSIVYTSPDGTTQQLGPFATEEVAEDEYAPVTTVVVPGPVSDPEPSPSACEQDPSSTACDG